MAEEKVMIAFHVDTLERLLAFAKDFLFEQKLLFAGDSEERRHIQLVEDRLKAVYEMGYLTAMDEVRSTPWEYVSQPIVTDAARNDREMNLMAREGWELQFISSGWMFWRRRKAVSDGTTDNAN